MSFYHLREKISYQLHSLSRHGVHSPFVYDFVEQVIRRRDAVSTQLSLPAALPAAHRRILLRTMQYYGCRELLSLQDGQVRSFATGLSSSAHALHFDRLLLMPVTAITTLQDATTAPYATGTTIIALYGLHDTPAHKARWETLSADASVTLSLDLFETGLLFFREDFLVKQQFLLKV